MSFDGSRHAWSFGAGHAGPTHHRCLRLPYAALFRSHQEISSAAYAWIMRAYHNAILQLGQLSYSGIVQGMILLPLLRGTEYGYLRALLQLSSVDAACQPALPPRDGGIVVLYCSRPCLFSLSWFRQGGWVMQWRSGTAELATWRTAACIITSIRDSVVGAIS